MDNRLRPSRFLIVAFALAVFCLCPGLLFCPNARAADHIWTGLDGTDFWSNPGNWSGSSKPNTPGDTVVFNVTTIRDLDVNEVPPADLKFRGDAGFNRTLEVSNNNLTLLGDPAVDCSAGGASAQINFNQQITLTGASSFSGCQNNLSFVGAVANGGFPVTTNSGSVLIRGGLSGAGGLTVQGGDTKLSDTATTYTGATTVASGTLQIECAMASTSYNITGGTLRNLAADRLPDNAAMAIGAAGVWELNGFNETIGALSGAGQADLGAGNLTFGDASDTTFSGFIGGDANTGNVIKQGSGKVTLTGGSRTIFTGGTLYINAGTLQADNVWFSSAVNVASGATLQGSGFILTATAPVTVNAGGTLAPGGSPGQLACDNGVALADGSNFNVELDGTTEGTGYDQLVVLGGVVSLAGNLNVTVGFSPDFGETFTIIDNETGGAVSGTFTGLAEGGTFTADGYTFEITYVGGDGDDVVLTVVSPTITSFSPQTGGQGAVVTITGNGFSDAAAASTDTRAVLSVQFGGTDAAAFTVNSSTNITATVGNGSTGAVTVTNSKGTGTSTGTFTFNAPIPTLNQWALILLGLMLAAASFHVLRKRKEG